MFTRQARAKKTESTPQRPAFKASPALVLRAARPATATVAALVKPVGAHETVDWVSQRRQKK